MDEQRRRIVEDLSGLLKGELRCDPLTAAMYATDGSLYQIAPVGVAFPRDREDVVTLARYSAESDVPLIARGAGTGIAGNAVGSGLVVDFSRFMHRIEAVYDETVRVQPGIVRDRLNQYLRPFGRYLPPDPSNSAITTIGGMLGVDAAGSHSVRVGATRDHVDSIETVLAGGDVVEFGNEPLDLLRRRPAGIGVDSIPHPDDSLPRGERRTDVAEVDCKRTIVSKLAKLLSDNDALIRERQPPLIRNVCGYFLRGILSDSRLNAARMLVGSEGTLGLFTAATLHTAPLPAHRGAVLILFGQLEAAVRTVQAVSGLQPSACDLLDRRLLSLARDHDPRFGRMISPAAEAGLLIEQTGFGDREVRDRIQQVKGAVHSVNLRSVVVHEAYTFDEVELLWSLTSAVVPLLNRLKGETRPLPFVEDVAVPPEMLHEFLVKAQKVFQNHEVTASLYSHALAGQIHLRPFFPFPTEQDGPRLETIARDLYQVVFSVGGSISGEHGDGLSRTSFIRSQYGPLYRVFQEIKDLFDPHNLLNPGKIVSDDAHLTIRQFRPAAVPSPNVVNLQLRWKPAELAEAAFACNGCGNCRTQDAALRMCPFFRRDTHEETSPRSKANVVRHYATGQLSPEDFASPDMKRLANLCFNCKQCQLECPSNVNIPQMMIEAKAAYVAVNGLSRADWILSRAHSFGPLGCMASLAFNWVSGNPTARWLLERLAGIARHRKLPRFARRPFLHVAHRRLLKPPEQGGGLPPVAVYLGDYANYYDHEIARALVAVLHHNDVPVFVPPGQTSSGMAMISAGDLDAARPLAEHNVRELAELARDGYSIVCSEPSSAVALKQEYPMLVDHPDVELVASQVVEAGAFLEGLHNDGRMRTDFAPLDLDVGYHQPCHLKALGAGSPLSRLLALIPDLRVHRIEKGCSGMAGSFGLTRENFRTSLRIGWDLITRMRGDDLGIGATECSSCKIQMEQGTTTPTLHPLKLVALSYGLMPEIRQKLEPSHNRLLVT